MSIKPGWEGRYLEDFEVGDIYRHPLGRTISKTDNTWFTLLTCNTNMVHFNSHYAKHSNYGELLVNSALSLALVMGLSVTDVSHQAMANLGMDEVRFNHPVFVGDTIYAESIVLAVRSSASRPQLGIVTVRTRGLNQNGEECLSYVRSAMVYKRGCKPESAQFPEPTTPLIPNDT